MHIIKPPHNINSSIPHVCPSIFLAGSIEMGAAEDWQKTVEKFFENEKGVIFNPRRDDWDNNWIQDISNHHFKEQVEWELQKIQNVDIVLFHFDPNTKSPITLMELGLVAGTHSIRQQRIVVSCPDGFWRRGNVQIICNKFKITLKNNLTDSLEYVKNIISADIV